MGYRRSTGAVTLAAALLTTFGAALCLTALCTTTFFAPSTCATFAVTLLETGAADALAEMPFAVAVFV